MKKYTMESNLNDILSSPMANDNYYKFIMAGVSIGSGNKQVGQGTKLKDLPNISNGGISDSLLQSLLKKLNDYEDVEGLEENKEITKQWWKESVCYQIYPRSFNDSNGDGIGDVRGIIDRLDYLKDLGVDIIWLSPIYESPNDDNGYDISDYYGIMKEFGTMDDVDELISEVHKRGMKFIMDMVINHTSDEHIWYKEALKGKDNKYRDYYIWREGKEGNMPPNNWASLFTGSAWNYDEASEEWALHLFSKKQMDLNWENPHMREDIYKMMNWWLDKGVDGFRLDVITLLAKEEGLPDGDPLISQLVGIPGIEHYGCIAKLHDYLRELNDNVFSKHDMVTVGEAPFAGFEVSKLITHEDKKELNLIFNFDHLDILGQGDVPIDYTYNLNDLKNYYIKWQSANNKSCWDAIFLENHDIPRVVSRISRDKTMREPIAKMLAAMMLTLRGTPFIYQGQEIGSINNQFESIKDYRDVASINQYHVLKAAGELSEDEIYQKLNVTARDHSRTPMAWDGSEKADFTTGKPWIMVNQDNAICNVKDQLNNPDSVLSFYKEMIQLRKRIPALVYGDFIPYKTEKEDYFAYYRVLDNEKYFVEINISEFDGQSFAPKEVDDMIIVTDCNTQKNMMPYEARVYKCR